MRLPQDSTSPATLPTHPPAPLPHPSWMHADLAGGGHAERRVQALMSSRQGGVSLPPYADCNLGDHVQDDPRAVAHNRMVFAQAIQAQPVWLTQVHGNRVVRLSRTAAPSPLSGHDGACNFFNPELDADQPHADGAITTEPGLACTVMVADCLPVLLAAPQGRGVAALHAGWRGLAGAGDMAGQGILHTGVRALCEATGADPQDLQAWLGPCIGPTQFEVGPDVLIGFGVDPAKANGHRRFKAGGLQAQPGVAPRAKADMAAVSQRWLADLPGLARDTLSALGVRHVSGGTWCTVGDASRFFSFRRDGVTGRQAAGICLL